MNTSISTSNSLILKEAKSNNTPMKNKSYYKQFSTTLVTNKGKLLPEIPKLIPQEPTWVRVNKFITVNLGLVAALFGIAGGLDHFFLDGSIHDYLNEPAKQEQVIVLKPTVSSISYKVTRCTTEVPSTQTPESFITENKRICDEQIIEIDYNK